jgi:transcriptional regulator with XRE-family HTH domain
VERTVGQLHRIQAATGWSQERISKELNVSYQSVNHWMNGKVTPMAPYRAMIEALAERVTGEES